MAFLLSRCGMWRDTDSNGRDRRRKTGLSGMASYCDPNTVESESFRYNVM